uniref:Uncharacterized protein n=1 Tax=Percolomonas cosmopolitus TaxID=63605 RepID=A0A7S1KTB1_9EUKA|mmetsp:Transcript_8777/g.32475  ORF Transcript_8777/g.32475 Transcript_8777/m.32475 type:complete len:574 (+) Transcript_8777:175-1896(+)
MVKSPSLRKMHAKNASPLQNPLSAPPVFHEAASYAQFQSLILPQQEVHQVALPPLTDDQTLINQCTIEILPQSPTKLMPPPMRPRSSSAVSPALRIQSLQELDSVVDRCSLRDGDKLLWLSEECRFVLGVLRVEHEPNTHSVCRLMRFEHQWLQQLGERSSTGPSHSQNDVAPWSCTSSTQPQRKVVSLFGATQQSFSYYTMIRVRMHKSECFDLSQKLPESAEIGDVWPRVQYHQQGANPNLHESIHPLPPSPRTFEQYFSLGNDYVCFLCNIDELRRPRLSGAEEDGDGFLIDSEFLEYNTILIAEERDKRRQQLSNEAQSLLQAEENQNANASIRHASNCGGVPHRVFHNETIPRPDLTISNSPPAAAAHNTNPSPQNQSNASSSKPDSSSFSHPGATYSAHTLSLTIDDSLLVPISSNLPPATVTLQTSPPKSQHVDAQSVRYGGESISNTMVVTVGVMTDQQQGEEDLQHEATSCHSVPPTEKEVASSPWDSLLKKYSSSVLSVDSLQQQQRREGSNSYLSYMERLYPDIVRKMKAEEEVGAGIVAELDVSKEEVEMERKETSEDDVL